MIKLHFYWEQHKTSNKFRIFDILRAITQEEYMETRPMTWLTLSYFRAQTSANIHIYNWKRSESISMWFPLLPSLACKILHFGQKLTLTCSNKLKKWDSLVQQIDLVYFLQCLANFYANLTSLKEKVQKTSSSFSFHILRYKIIEMFCIGTNKNCH